MLQWLTRPFLPFASLPSYPPPPVLTASPITRVHARSLALPINVTTPPQNHVNIMEMLINRDASLAMIENDDGETALDMLRRRSRGASSRAENTVNRRTASVERLQEGAATASFLLECAEGDEGREKWSLAEGGEGEEGSVRQESGGGRQESGGGSTTMPPSYGGRRPPAYLTTSKLTLNH